MSTSKEDVTFNDTVSCGQVQTSFSMDTGAGVENYFCANFIDIDELTADLANVTIYVQPFRIMDIPFELRMMVWRHAVALPCPVHIPVLVFPDTADFPSTAETTLGLLLPSPDTIFDHALLKVNDQIKAEGTEAYFKANTFRIGSGAAGSWVQSLTFPFFDFFTGDIYPTNGDIDLMGICSGLQEVEMTFNIKQIIQQDPTLGGVYKPRPFRDAVAYYRLRGLLELPAKTKLKKIKFDCMSWNFNEDQVFVGHRWATMKKLVDWLKGNFEKQFNHVEVVAILCSNPDYDWSTMDMDSVEDMSIDDEVQEASLEGDLVHGGGETAVASGLTEENSQVDRIESVEANDQPENGSVDEEMSDASSVMSELRDMVEDNDVEVDELPFGTA
ncbi:hypothetical protein EJ08DRAFT_733339 [Tothia fuscella]|uniref:Uncharacterized protein n=1 Tax=Tothia fuscella TaxID=1048955 RepID=A0A9P4NTG0_9PEZI|nr:hypothetical protein EJ08DRAFT_733339 [Tothia fuscella]